MRLRDEAVFGTTVGRTGFTGSVNLSVSGLPPAATSQFSISPTSTANGTTPGFGLSAVSATVTVAKGDVSFAGAGANVFQAAITVPAYAPSGTYSVPVTAQGVARTATVALTVIVP